MAIILGVATQFALDICRTYAYSTISYTLKNTAWIKSIFMIISGLLFLMLHLSVSTAWLLMLSRTLLRCWSNAKVVAAALFWTRSSFQRWMRAALSLGQGILLALAIDERMRCGIEGAALACVLTSRGSATAVEYYSYINQIA